jgi:peptide-methionine (S)-S-oxide reductase
MTRSIAKRRRAIPSAMAAVSAALLMAGCSAAGPGNAAARVPAPAFDSRASGATETAVLSGGCFWGIQGVFQHVKGVKNVVSGYSGGAKATAQYETVSTGVTGHAESVEITYDPRQVSYGQILQVFFSVATDPTQVNRQFPDEGTQYRSEIFYRTPEQKAVAERYIAQLNAAKVFPRPIATRVDPDKGFFRAEGYHQNYLLENPDQPYIATYDLPKVRDLKALFPELYRPTPIRAV